MLKFEHADQLEAFLTTQRAVGGNVDYLEDVLKLALLRGDWDELEKMVIYHDDKLTILFGDDKWAFKNTDSKAKAVANLLFSIQNDLPTNVLRFGGDERNIRNQIKCLALVYIYFITDKVTLGSTNNITSKLRNNAKYMLAMGVNSFEAVTEEILFDWMDNGLDLSAKNAFKGLNALCSAKGVLPFNVNYSLLTHKTFDFKADEGEQYCAIPPRLYFESLNKFSAIIKSTYAVRDEIEQAVKQMILFEKQSVKEAIYKIRHGGGIKNQRSLLKSFNNFVEALGAAGVAIADREEDDRWMKIFNECQATVIIQTRRLNKFKVTIAGKTYGWTDFRNYIRELNNQAAWLCMALSGMRVDELWRVHPEFGAQTMSFDKDGNESDNGKEIIYFLTTRQSKISINSQTKDDVFVTTLMGWKAFHVLSAIHTPLRALFPKDESNRMFASLKSTQKPIVLSKDTLGQATMRGFNNDGQFDLVLTDRDMNYLNASDPTQKSFKLGDSFHFQNHQLRRSLAYYLIGYELCSFPALKQQLGHFSMAMTRWYARNASSFQKLYSEIQHERTVQHADIFARIYQKLANGERIAGGRGKAAMQEISRQGKSYFEEGVNRRLLSRDYWIETLKAGDAHLHVTAPGIVCTNTQCSMRINIDLSDCVDCGYDYIEDVVYAESSRMDAMRNLNLLIEWEDLNASSASKYYMQIKAAETIMKDLEFNFEPYEFQEEVTKLLIETPVVMVG